MQFHSCISDEENADDALEQVIDAAREASDGQIDAAFIFFTSQFARDAERIVEQIWLELDPQCAVGSSGEGVIGAAREMERTPALALLVGSLPGVRLHPFHIAGASAWREVIDDADELRNRIGIGDQTRAIIALGDPFTTPLDPFIEALAAGAPGLPVVGGMASGGRNPGSNRLVRNDEMFDEGLVGLSISGPIEVQTVVSQGCRPIGRPFVITKSHDNIIEQLGGRPAMAALGEIVKELSSSDQSLLQKGLMIGRAISEYREEFGRGDFLVRNVIGADDEGGSLAVADHIRTGQTVQFHVRDAATADEDLRLLLNAQQAKAAAAGGLAVQLQRAWTRMFGRPGHDIGAAAAAMPATPFAGFFAGGEFGPVGGKNFIHGHTASLALFRKVEA